MNDCNNKLGNEKLLWNPTGWYETEDFFTKEKCRLITVEIETELIGKNKNWNDCKELVEKEKGQMLSFAEMIFFYQEYFKQTGKYIDENEWSWTQSRSSDGSLVGVGSCDSGGVGVSNGEPGGSRSSLGVRFMRSDVLNNELTTPRAFDTLEESIDKVKKAGYLIFKSI